MRKRRAKSAEQLRRELAAELEPYRVILEPFVRGDMTADEFETCFFPMYADDPRMSSDEVFDIVDRFFSDVDAYVGDPALRAQVPDSISAEELRELARQLLARAGIEVEGANPSSPPCA